MLSTVLQVAIGGALGSLARFAVQTGTTKLLGPAFPAGTMLANVFGSLIIGILFAYVLARSPFWATPLLMTGILGGFTTFSTFALDAVVLWERGAVWPAAAYVLGTVVLSIAAAALGLWLGRGWFG